MSHRASPLPVLYLSLVAAGFAALIWRQATLPIDTSPIVDAGAKEDVAVIVPETTGRGSQPVLAPLLSPEEIAEISARPLFAPDRKPFVAPPPAVAEAGPEAPVADVSADGFRLVGTLRLGRTTSRALIRTPGKPAAQWVEVGRAIEGWTLDTIEKDRALLKRDGQLAELKLFVPEAGADARP